MFESPFMDAVIFTVPGTPLSINWYGLTFAATFLFGIWYANRRSDRAPAWGITREMNSDLLLYMIVGVIVGARLGYVLFYGLDQLLPFRETLNAAGDVISSRTVDFLFIFKIHEGGLSFHGGFLGVCVAYILFARKHRVNPFTIADWVVPIIPMGIVFVRMGNTINGELWGRVTESPLGVYFMALPENAMGAVVARHPSTIYEMVLEGVVMFIVMQWFIRKPRPRMAASGLFVMGYGFFRTAVEFFRQPDAQLGVNGFLYGTDWITRGMTLSVPMIFAGAAMLVIAYHRNVYDHARQPSSRAAT
ncbi:prolipoprotein diacylglyceryl transferase [Marinagarivorans cellulosilyticus]|uniref:Phosphatidylglycerol--prolipoprotein diacylglyceryl transferase n=1 Tax=Marinagarivorans cellulosilyticus TaxID=2721545 RepID=A0AAN1WHQ5_9GAMM|nr:prolipoprotein diacylglyceryl transferase [Marinagarivorans cellulosilyticus]BCD97825.1 phosphatidylglycerol---prolipoprotein diacylglyceryl transferase [Marinagarivorans cellulosilyticus]